MLVSNGKKLLQFPQVEAEKLEETAKLLKKRAKDVLGINAKFPIKEDPFPHIINQDELEWKELKQICMPDLDLQFRAIGPEKVQMPETRHKDIKYQFTLEEKNQIADQFCNAQYDKEKEEAEAKRIAKEFKQAIDALEAQISELSMKHRQGYEMRTIECNLHLDFENGVRIYTDINSEEIMHTGPMTIEDKQLKIEFGDAVDFDKAVPANDSDPFAIEAD